MTLIAVYPPDRRTVPFGDPGIGLLRQHNGLDVVVPLKVDRASFESEEFKFFAACMRSLHAREQASQK